MNPSARRDRNHRRLAEVLGPWRNSLQNGIEGRLAESFTSELVSLLCRVEVEELDRCLDRVRYEAIPKINPAEDRIDQSEWAGVERFRDRLIRRFRTAIMKSIKDYR